MMEGRLGAVKTHTTVGDVSYGGLLVDQLIHVSQYNGTINWPMVRLSGIKGAIIRCCVDDAAADPFFAYNWQSAKEQGMARMAVLYAKPNIDTPRAQADHALAILESDLCPNDGLVLDLQEGDGNLVDWAEKVGLTWEKEYPENPRLLHSSLPFFRERLNANKLAHLFDLYVGDWSATPGIPSAWPGWEIWQYTDTGVIPGVSGHVARAQCEDIAAWLGGENPVTASRANPAPIVGPQGGFVVAQRGDTMFSIATAQNVTSDELEAANPNVKDPIQGEIIHLPGSLVSTKPSNAETYIAHPGDTLASVAQSYGRKLSAVGAANPNVNRLHVGQPVFIPPNPTHTWPNPRTKPPLPVRRTMRVGYWDTPSTIAGRLGARADKVYPGQILDVP